MSWSADGTTSRGSTEDPFGRAAEEILRRNQAVLLVRMQDSKHLVITGKC
jgi:hypothetical protein